jgi:hypothetical protein
MSQEKIQVTVFTNNRKKSEKSPDFSGEVVFPDGRKMEIALWNSKSKNGLPYMRGHIGEKFQPQGGQGGYQGGGNAGYSQPQSNAVKIDF